MDPTTVITETSTIKLTSHEVVDLTSDSDDSVAEHVLGETPPTGVSEGELESEDDDDELDPSESMSLLEDVLQEMGDENLFEGGKSRRTDLSTCVN
jgi:hypothetical protein